MTERNPLAKTRRETVREVFTKLAGTLEASLPSSGKGQFSPAGESDDDGDWQPYGLLDITPMEEFRLAP